MMNIVWKIGVNSQATVLMGSTPGLAGSSGDAWGVGVGLTAPEPVVAPPGTHAAIASAMKSPMSSAGPIRRRVGEMVTSARPR